MGEAPDRPKRRSRATVPLLALSGVLALLIAGGGVMGIVTIHHVEASVPTIAVGPDCQRTDSDCLVHVDQECTNDVCNFLILGSDSRKGVSKQIGSTQGSPGQRSDTIIVVTVDPRINRTTVMSIPRDLRVDIPGFGLNKINTAFNHPHGRDLIVQTVEKLTGLSINHYVDINFLGFEGLVNALGGVPICINRRLIDELAGLNLPHAGCYNLKGAQALAFVRARHVEGDNIPDFSRISRQQQFMRALIQKALSAQAIFKLPSLFKAIQDNLQRDKNLNLYELQDLTRKLADLGQRGVDFRIVPAVPLPPINGVDYLQLEQPQASQLFERIRDGKRLGQIGVTALLTTVSPANVTVQVLDANSGGHAEEVQKLLERAGFVVLPLGQAPPELTTSEILYRTDTQSVDFKEVVASYLTLFPVGRSRTHTTGSIVTVVVGPDFPGFEGVAGSG
jgi:LCP family protein required for cell wall assembly